MKNLFFVLFTTTIVFSFSQITATTAGGKKVILFMDKTWKYADPEDEQTGDQDCINNHYGSVEVVNNSDHDIYFYCTNGLIGFDNITKKIKANSKKLIENLYSKYGTSWNYMNTYKWKVSYEYQTISPNALNWLNEIDGYENGQFFIKDCKVVEVIIED